MRVRITAELTWTETARYPKLNLKHYPIRNHACLKPESKWAETNNITFGSAALPIRRLVWLAILPRFYYRSLRLLYGQRPGPIFHYSDTWQLIKNTGTSVLTFLVVFLIQNTQNRDAKASHLKLDELIRSHSPAHNDMIDIENLSDEELEELEKRYAAICKEHVARQKKNTPEPKLV